MAGGLMQLVAYGAQDVFLTGNPKVTFFQAVYKRHTNFAMETIEQTVNGSPAPSGRVSTTIARNGDLVADMFVEMKAKSGLNTDTKTSGYSAVWAAERAIKDVELSIGGQRVDKTYNRFWRLYAELYLTSDKKAQWGKMTSAVDSTIYLPLIFFFNRNPGLALPLIALQYHEVRLDFDLTDQFANYTDGSTFKVWANYVYLDTEERRRFSQKGHEYLIEQVQHTGTDSIKAGATKQVRLSYNHPVKSLIFCADSGASTGWNFASNALPADVVLTTNPRTTSNVVVSTVEGTGAPMLWASGTGGSAKRWVEDGAVSGTDAVGPIETFKLVLNGQDRFKEQPGKYFNQVQPFVHFDGTPYPGVYAYSFALEPTAHQPTGTCNFSRIDNAQVAIKVKDLATTSESLHMFAVNYNVLRIQSGMGGLAFSN